MRDYVNFLIAIDINIIYVTSANTENVPTITLLNAKRMFYFGF